MDKSREEEILLIPHGNENGSGIEQNAEEDNSYSMTIENRDSCWQRFKGWIKKFCNSEYALIEES